MLHSWSALEPWWALVGGAALVLLLLVASLALRRRPSTTHATRSTSSEDRVMAELLAYHQDLDARLLRLQQERGVLLERIRAARLRGDEGSVLMYTREHLHVLRLEQQTQRLYGQAKERYHQLRQAWYAATDQEALGRQLALQRDTRLSERLSPDVTARTQAQAKASEAALSHVAVHDADEPVVPQAEIRANEAAIERALAESTGVRP